jgi:prolyl-tRNA synthetase
MSTLQKKETWEKTDRWDDEKVDIWFKSKLKNDTEVGLGFTHEEPLTSIMKDHIRSFRDLPVLAYQFQTKFRNETRAKSGIMRTREFLMKDLYTFSKDDAEHAEYYEKIKKSYVRVFDRIGMGSTTYLTFASGGMFSKFSHEFQTLTEAGEDTIYVDRDKGIAINKEVYTDEVIANLGLTKESLVEERAVEVGNIFTLGTKFSEPIGLYYTDEAGEKQPVFMGSYGIGPSRLMGTIVEVLSDDKGIIWPESVAPFSVHVLRLGESEAVVNASNELYAFLSGKGIEVLFDDRGGVTAGEKFADSDLLGVPYRVVVSERSIKDGGYEVKKRTEEKGKIVSQDELLNLLAPRT